MYCHLFTCNSYNSCNRYTRTIKMVYFHNSFEYRQKSATYAAKSFQLLGGSPPDPLTSGSAPGPRCGHSPQTRQTTIICTLNTCYFPQTQGSG